MKEILFIRQNIKEWQQIEAMLDRLAIETPDDISAAYIRVTSDLAFAQTHYPTSRITGYLNNLAVVPTMPSTATSVKSASASSHSGRKRCLWRCMMHAGCWHCRL